MAVASLLDSLARSFSIILPLVANLILALFVLLIGFLVAQGLGTLTTFILKAVQLDRGAEQIGFNSVLEKGNIKKTISELFGSLIYWIVALAVVIGVIAAFGLQIMPALAKVFAYMGIVFLAAFILGIGLLLGGLISGIVRVILVNLGLEGAKTVSRVIYYIIIAFAFLAALAELGVSGDVFVPHLGVIIGAFGLAAAIAFGLGCKDMAADFLHNLFKGK